MRLIDAHFAQHIANKELSKDDAGTVYWVLSHTPTFDPEELHRKGRWLEVDDSFGDSHWKCSACKEEWWFEAGGPEENGSNYCPNCGAKMGQFDN